MTESLRGEGDSLKETVLARELYGKGQDFDTAADPVVRIDARRLRDKLREYYSEFGSDPVLVTVPKGTYAPVFEWNPNAPNRVVAAIPLRGDSRSVPQQSIILRKRYLVAAGILLGLIGASVWLLRSGSPEPAPAVMPLTALPGLEGAPSFSPDGQSVAFDWMGTEKDAVSHIYIKEVHGEDLRQLTYGTGEHNPAWSPDGNHIAYIRGNHGVYMTSQIGGSEQKISNTGTHVGWTPDSKSILFRAISRGGEREQPFGIYQMSLETWEKHEITQPTTGFGDFGFSVSPDGRTLAFVRFRLPGVGDVFVVPMSGGGEPRRLTNWSAVGTSVAWTPDGRDIVYTVNEAQGGRIWHIPWKTAKPGRGTPLTSQTGDAAFVSVARQGANHPARLAYQVKYADIGLRLVDLTVVSDGKLTSVQHIRDSTRVQTKARFSPDGSRLIFASNRSGMREIWISNRDGSDLRQRTFLGGPNTLPGDWSPDGLLIQATVDDNSDIYVMPADTGKPRRLTSDSTLHMTPSWSADGKWIYYSATPAPTSGDKHRSQIWRMPAGGGPATQITREGGFDQQESFDGKFLYYLDSARSTPSDSGNVMRIPVGGGDPVNILRAIPGELWSLTSKGMFYVTRDGKEDTINLRLEDGTTAPVGSLPFRVSSSMTVSRDGRWLITNETNRYETDLMLIENFKK